jgi:cell shape-determining protein MreC
METDISRKLLSFWFLLLMGCVIFVGMERLGWSGMVWQVSEQVTVPVKSVIWGQYDLVQDRLGWWQYWRSEQEELVRLKFVMREEVLLVAEVAELRKENEELRRLLGATFPGYWEFLPSKVVGWSAGQMVVDKGFDQGLQAGMMVVAAPQKDSNLGILVGRVSRLHAQQAWVETVQNQDLIVSVKVRDGKTTGEVGEGLLSWRAGELQVDKLLPDEPVKVGDVVLTSGEEGFDIEAGRGWLAGIPIGVISEVSFERETDVYQQAKVSWLIGSNELDQVFVVTGW